MDLKPQKKETDFTKIKVENAVSPSGKPITPVAPGGKIAEEPITSPDTPIAKDVKESIAPSLPPDGQIPIKPTTAEPASKESTIGIPQQFAETPPEEVPADIVIREQQGGPVNSEQPKAHTHADIQAPHKVMSSQASQSTQSSQVVKIRFGGFWVRLAAFFVDSIIVGLIAFPASIFLGFLGAALTAASLGAIDGSTLAYIAGLSLGALYHVITLKAYGATVGKMMVGLKVVADDGTPLSLNQIIVREVLGKFVSNLTFGIGYLMMAFTGKKQALHDKMAHSIVIYKNPNKKNIVAILIIVLFAIPLFVIFIIGILGSLALVGVKSAREKANIAYVASEMRPTMHIAEVCMENEGIVLGPRDIHEGGGPICSIEEGFSDEWPSLRGFPSGENLAYDFIPRDQLGGFSIVREDRKGELVVFCSLVDFTCKTGMDLLNEHWDSAEQQLNPLKDQDGNRSPEKEDSSQSEQNKENLKQSGEQQET